MKCSGTTSGSKACNAFAMKNSSYCFTHNPETKLAHKRASSNGGSKKNIQLIRLPAISEVNGTSIILLLTDTINRIRVVSDEGIMDIKTANAVGHLSGKLIESYKLLVLENRLKHLEDQFNGSTN